MKRTKLTLSLLLLSGSILFAQNVGINADGSSPDGSAMLDVKSTSKGFLPPRIALTGSEGDLEKNETLGLSYGNLVPVLTKAIQEQQAQINELKQTVAELSKLLETARNK